MNVSKVKLTRPHHGSGSQDVPGPDNHELPEGRVEVGGTSPPLNVWEDEGKTETYLGFPNSDINGKV